MTTEMNAATFTSLRARLLAGTYSVNQPVYCAEAGYEGWGKVLAIGSYSDDGQNILTSGSLAWLRDSGGVRWKYEVDLRDWNGLDLTGNNENNSILAAALAQAAYPTVDRLFIPRGVVAFTETLVPAQSATIFGVNGVDGGSVLKWVGADGDHAIETIAQTSFLRFEKLRIIDARTSPTSGDGIHLERAVNGVDLRGLQVFNFPGNQIYIGAQSGQSGDCTTLDDIWVNSSVSGANGVYVERMDNHVALRNIKSDLSGGGAVIVATSLGADNTALSINGVKHEASDDTKTIYFPTVNAGNTDVSNVNQRRISGAGGDIITFDYLTTRVRLQNISGNYHNTWNSGPCVVHCRNAATSTIRKFWGPIYSARTDANGRVYRDMLGGNSAPNGVIYGHVGELYSRQDSGSSANPVLYEKRSGSATNTSWTALSPKRNVATYNPPSLADGASQTTTVTVSGAVLGDVVTGVSFSISLSGTTMTGEVTAADTVTITHTNRTGGTVDLASGTIRVLVAENW